jgi:hypothetical protein
VALTGLEVDETGCGQCPLVGFRTDKQLSAGNEHECMLMHLVLLQDITLGQQQRDHAIGAIIGAKDLRVVSGDTQTI